MQQIDKNELIENITILAKKDLQEEKWKSLVNGDFHSFDENIARLFDDSGLGKALDKGESERLFSEALTEKFKQLEHQAQQIPASQLSPDEIINHPGMEDIRNTAAEILTELKSSTN